MSRILMYLFPPIQRFSSCSTRSTSEGSTCSSGSNSTTDGGLPEAPTNCCMTGCSNCVWIQYADSLINHYKDGGVKAREELEQLVTDPTLKMFLRLELSSKMSAAK